MKPTRRALLGGLLPLVLPRPAWALGDSSKVDVAEITLGSGTLSRPEAWTRLLFEVIQTTSIEAVPRVVQVAPDDPTLFKHPIAVLCGNAALPALSERAREQLVRYLSYGGFLFVDDASGTTRSEFDRSVRSIFGQLFPTRTLAVLPADHSVYRSFFLLRTPMGRIATHQVLEGIAVGSMHPLIYSQDDVSGALDRNPDGSEANACTPGGELQRREAVKLAINLVMYALTSNYKQDQAHVNELMREGRLE